MLTQFLLILVIALCVPMLVLYYKKTLPVVPMDLFVDLKNDINRKCSISFLKNTLATPRFIKQIVANNNFKNDDEGGVISNNLYAKSVKVRARSPTQFNEIGSLMRC